MKWTTKEGNTYDIGLLETKHLKNILAMLKRNNGTTYVIGDLGFDASEAWAEEGMIDNSERIEAVQFELRLRSIESRMQALELKA